MARKFEESFFKRENENDDDINIVSGDKTLSAVKNKGIWKRFFHMCAVAQLPYLFILIYIGLSVAQSNISVKIPQIDGNFFGGNASVKSVSMFLGFEILSMVMTAFITFVNHVLRGKMNRNLRNALWGKILKLKPRYFDKVSSNTLISRITVDSDSMNEFIMDVILELGVQVYTLLLTIKAMSKISIKAGLMLLAFLPLSVLFAFVMGRLDLKFETKLKFKMSDLTNYLSELVSCLPLLQAYNKQGYESRRGHKIINDFYTANRSISIIDLIRQIAGAAVAIGPEIIIIMMGVKMLNANQVNAAGWYTFYMYAGTFIGFCNTLGTLWQTNKATQGKLYKVSDILYEDEERIDEYVSEIVESGDIIFDKVSFGYEEDIVLDRVSFTIPKNKNTMIVGYSGSGKSTVLKLLERMYDPKDGRILMGGENINNYAIKDWRSRVTLVSQNTPLMTGSIRENILYGIKRPVTDEEIMEAAKLANVYEYINNNPEGLDYQVGQFGCRLSGGQRQKLSITRAILTNSEYMFFDEPTASLDITSTNEIANTIIKLRGKRTIVVVTHDSSLIKAADHIIVIDKDHSSNEGNAEELKLTSEFYNDLMNE
mgnify:CR=1 FL=1